MQIPLQVVGLDMRKATLDVCYQVQSQLVQLDVANTPAGFRQLVRRCGTQCLYILEATGPYHLAAATYLVAAGAEVAVVNPLVVRRFIQMHLGKGKSDRKDAQWLPVFRPAAARGTLAAAARRVGGMPPTGAGLGIAHPPANQE